MRGELLVGVEVDAAEHRRRPLDDAGRTREAISPAETVPVVGHGGGASGGAVDGFAAALVPDVYGSPKITQNRPGG
jgi:hypothetical protein